MFLFYWSYYIEHFSRIQKLILVTTRCAISYDYKSVDTLHCEILNWNDDWTLLTTRNIWSFVLFEKNWEKETNFSEFSFHSEIKHHLSVHLLREIGINVRLILLYKMFASVHAETTSASSEAVSLWTELTSVALLTENLTLMLGHSGRLEHFLAQSLNIRCTV